MKLLSVAVPCYNSQEYMSHAIDSLLLGGEDIEILIIDDGSKDNTSKIADDYEKKYPNIIKAIHQENGGHGEAVNTGLKNATGLYYKVVDSDDWVKESALHKVMKQLRQMIEDGTNPDLMIANYVYEKVYLGKKKVINYKSALPENKIFTWEEIGHFKASQNILMHSVIYRTKLLRDCGLELPKHTFYVDNIFVFQPLPSVKTMYYMNVNLYRYFIGREDQSVNEEVIMTRIDQQIRVTKLMIQSHDIMSIRSMKLKKYMIKYLAMMMTVCSTYLIKINTEESLKMKEELWNYLKKQNRVVYKKIRSCILGRSMHLPGSLGRKLVKIGYKVTQKIYKFG